MAFNTFNKEEESEFVEMFKHQINRFNSTLSEASFGVELGSIANSPSSSSLMAATSFLENNYSQTKKTCKKSLSFTNAVELQENSNVTQELDLNKTYTSKTMDPKQLALMLAALEDDED